MGLTMSDEREGRIRKSVSHYAESIERDPAFREKHGLGPPPEHDDELLLAELDATRARLAISEEQLVAVQQSAKHCVSCGLLLPNHADWCGRWEVVVSELRARLAEVEAERDALGEGCVAIEGSGVPWDCVDATMNYTGALVAKKVAAGALALAAAEAREARLAKRLAEVERERHREHEARVQMEHELSEAGCATVADLVRERDEARDKRAHETQHLLNCCAERDKALAAAEARDARLREALEDCEDWFGERADADAQGDPMEYVGNAEMHALGRVRRALAATAPGSRKALREKMLVAWMGGAFSGAAWMYAHLGGDEATALAHLNRFQAAAAGTTKAFHDWFASKYDGEEEADG